MGKNLALISFKYGILTNIVFNFHSGFSNNPYLFACKRIPHAKYEKKPH